LLAVALLGGLLLSLPTLTVFALAVLWHRAVGEGRRLPGVPRRLAGPGGARGVGAALVVTTVAYLVGLIVVTGPWALLAVPPAALALAAGRLLLTA
jgi:hypothetical protein